MMRLYIDCCKDEEVKKLVATAFAYGSDIYLTYDASYLYTDEDSPTYKQDFCVWCNGGGDIFNSQVLDYIRNIVQKFKGNNDFDEYRSIVKGKIKEVEAVAISEMHEMARRWRNGEKVAIDITELF